MGWWLVPTSFKLLVLESLDSCVILYISYFLVFGVHILHFAWRTGSSELHFTTRYLSRAEEDMEISPVRHCLWQSLDVSDICRHVVGCGGQINHCRRQKALTKSILYHVTPGWLRMYTRCTTLHDSASVFHRSSRGSRVRRGNELGCPRLASQISRAANICKGHDTP